MFKIYFIGCCLTHLLLSCEQSNSKKNDGKKLPNSLKVYRFNFRDEKYCKACIESEFIIAIPIGSIRKQENLILELNNEKKIQYLYSTLKTIEYSKKSNYDVDHNFIIVFKNVTGNEMIYSKLSHGEWLVNDSVIIKPKKDILEIIRMLVTLKDMTDYERVSKGPIALSTH